MEKEGVRGALVWQSFALVDPQSCTGQVEVMPWAYASPDAAEQFGLCFSRPGHILNEGQGPWPALLIQHNDTGVITVSRTEICPCGPSIPE